jgi:DNA-binding LytR/AlgR family response regulator
VCDSRKWQLFYLIAQRIQDQGRKTGLKINIIENAQYEELEVMIHCGRLTEEVKKLITLLRVMDLKLTGSRAGETYILDAEKVLYIDTVDRRTFFYLEKEVYESALRLYELEEKLAVLDFMRANKSCIVNFRKIRALKADLGGRLLLTMENGEKLYVSRQYAAEFKKKLEGAL